MRLFHTVTTLIVLCAFSASVSAQEPEKAWSLYLDTVTVKGNSFTSTVMNRTDGGLVWNMQLMDNLPKILGNADPMHYVQMLPGIQTNNEFKSGVNIQGCDQSHNLLTIGGVPIYNVSHLLGFFSTFNPSHYPMFTLYKSPPFAGAGNRLGGVLDMEASDEVADSVNGEYSIGLISSQGTLRAPLGRRTMLTASLRGSYVNLLYSRWLRADNQQIKYSFYDVNATLVHHIDQHHTLSLDFYGGNDDVSLSERHYSADMADKWGNTMGAVHWQFSKDKRFKARSTVYVTSYHNKFRLTMQDATFELPSSITDLGLKGLAEWQQFSCGLEAVWHDIHPQSLLSSGSYNISSGTTDVVHSLECSVFANYLQPLSSTCSLRGGLTASIYHQLTSTFQAIDPSISVIYSNNLLQMTATYALRHQYLFQTGFSNIGLPSEFWLSCDENCKPQYVHDWSLNFAAYLLDRRYRLSADVFYKRLFHQIEYSGSVLDFVNTLYDLDQQLLYGKGENYGFSFMINKCSGKLTGWLSYAYTRARRTFNQKKAQGDYSANHERPHEVNAVAICTLNPHWSLGATFVYASGTPFTAPESISLINRNLMIKYGEHNSSRLKPYCRTDFSVNYKWKNRWSRENGLNLSLYNAIAHRNELFYYIRHTDEGSFSYHPVSFMLDILPSVSYFCKF